ncbi:MAG: divalent-cation tolerance protein CutA [Pyrinomonadaceae bacterium]
METEQMLIVLTTCPAVEAAEALAEQIVEARLAACVQILPQMTSVYVWEDAVQKEGEFLLLIKTLPEKWDELREFISANHSYEVPEVIAIESGQVSDKYARWLEDIVSQ